MTGAGASEGKLRVGRVRAIVSDIDPVILVVHSNNSNLSPPRDEEPREREPVRRTAQMEGVVDGMTREEEEEQCHPVAQ